MAIREANERDIIRNLAREVAEIAAGDEQVAIRQRWQDVNALRKPDRAPVWCRPVDAWKELLPEECLVSQDRFHRGVERTLRQTLLKIRFVDDDTPVDPTWNVPAVFTQLTAHTWGVPIRRVEPETPGGAYRYEPPLKEDTDFDRLALPAETYDAAGTEQALDRAHELLGDILPVRLTCDAPFGAGLSGLAASLRGQGELMWDLADRPDLVHRLMAHLRDGILAAQQAREGTGLLTLNNTGPMYLSEPPRDPQPGDVRLSDLWISTESQDFDQVSPAMWEEFLLAYQLPILAQFRYVSYGCCENLTRKIGGVLRIPNLRVFVCSAWTDLAKVADAVGDRYTIMWRQKASDVVFAPDVEAIRRHLQEGLQIARGCHLQIVLRELQTLNGRPERLREWAAVAKDVAAGAA
jgi:hypothetical protein